MNEDSLIERMRKIFVSIERYELEVPQLKSILYAAISLIVMTVLVALLATVIKK